MLTAVHALAPSTEGEYAELLAALSTAILNRAGAWRWRTAEEGYTSGSGHGERERESRPRSL